MTAATTHRPRSTMPVISLLVAGAAAAVSVVAITTDDVGSGPVPAIATPEVDSPILRQSAAATGAGDCLIRAVVVRC